MEKEKSNQFVLKAAIIALLLAHAGALALSVHHSSKNENLTREHEELTRQMERVQADNELLIEQNNHVYYQLIRYNRCIDLFESAAQGVTDQHIIQATLDLRMLRDEVENDPMIYENQ